MKLFCKHKWEILTETTTKSKFEITAEVSNLSSSSDFTVPWQLADASRKHIIVVTCPKCGKIKKFVENI